MLTHARGWLLQKECVDADPHATATRWYTSSSRSAATRHVYRLARWRPWAISRVRWSGSVSSCSSAVLKPPTFVGSTIGAAPPATSGRHDAREATTGGHQAK